VFTGDLRRSSSLPSGPRPFAEPFVRTVRPECFDHALIYGRRHLERVLRSYVEHSLRSAPTGGSGSRLQQAAARPSVTTRNEERFPAVMSWGGLIHEYHWAA
jgi:hypothetical protein